MKAAARSTSPAASPAAPVAPSWHQALALAVEHQTHGRLPQAATAYQALLAAQPQASGVRHNLGLVLLALAQPGAALPHLDQAWCEDGGHPAWNQSLPEIGLRLYEQGLWEDALPWLTRALQRGATHPGLRPALNRCMPRSYLEPEVWDPQLRRTLLRQSPRESETYVYTIDVVGTCNLRCPTCPVGNSRGSQRPTGFMPLDLFERILDKIVAEAVTPNPAIWLFNWGEPLLHPELPRLIGAIKQRGLTCHLSSNMNITKGLQAVIKAGPDELKVSLSRFNPAEYQKTHVRGDLNLVKGNLYLLRHWLDEYDSPTRVWVGHHIYKGGEAEIPAVAALCQELGFQHHPIAAFFQPLERVIDVLDGKYVADPILQALPEHPKDYVPRLAAERSQQHDCELRFNQTIINFDGSLALCCNVYDSANMLKMNFLDTSHQAIQEARYQHPFCKICFERGLQYGVRDVRKS